MDEVLKIVRDNFKGKDLSSIKEKIAIEINLKEDGVFYIEILNGIASVMPYNYIDKDALVTISKDNFIRLISGKLDGVWAFTTKKLRIDGDIGKVIELTNLFK